VLLKPSGVAVVVKLIKSEIMDDKTKTGSPDSKRINVNEDHEVAYWTKELGVTSDKLKEAVDAVGTSAQAVREYLNK
jgi:hypothetical protein